MRFCHSICSRSLTGARGPRPSQTISLHEFPFEVGGGAAVMVCSITFASRLPLQNVNF